MSAKLEDFPTHTNWGTNPLADFSQLGRLEIDIRRAGNCDGSTNNLILDVYKRQVSGSVMPMGRLSYEYKMAD